MTAQAFTSHEVLVKLQDAATLYQEKAIFSRVAGLVAEALKIAVAADAQASHSQVAEADGYLKSTMATVLAVASKGESDALFLSLSAAQALLCGTAPIPQSGAFIALISMEIITKNADVQYLTPVTPIVAQA